MKIHYGKILLGLLVPLILGAVLVMAFLQAGNFAQASLIHETPTPADPILASLNRQIAQCDRDLKKSDLPDDVKKGLEAKKKYLEQQATERAEYLNHQEEVLHVKLTAIVNITLTPYPTQPPMETPTPYNGPITEFFAPMYREAHFSTAWLIQTDKRSLYILAGALVKDPDQGVIYIENDKDKTLEKYKTPYKDGSLKIKNVDKDRISLESKKGKKYFFNIDKKKFVDELDNPLPEVTSTPAPAYPPPE